MNNAVLYIGIWSIVRRSCSYSVVTFSLPHSPNSITFDDGVRALFSLVIVIDGSTNTCCSFWYLVQYTLYFLICIHCWCWWCCCVVSMHFIDLFSFLLFWFWHSAPHSTMVFIQEIYSVVFILSRLWYILMQCSSDDIPLCSCIVVVLLMIFCDSLSDRCYGVHVRWSARFLEPLIRRCEDEPFIRSFIRFHYAHSVPFVSFRAEPLFPWLFSNSPRYWWVIIVLRCWVVVFVSVVFTILPRTLRCCSVSPAFRVVCSICYLEFLPNILQSTAVAATAVLPNISYHHSTRCHSAADISIDTILCCFHSDDDAIPLLLFDSMEHLTLLIRWPTDACCFHWTTFLPDI